MLKNLSNIGSTNKSCVCDNIHMWLKMINFLLGQQTGHTKYLFFFCLRDRRIRKDIIPNKSD